MRAGMGHDALPSEAIAAAISGFRSVSPQVKWPVGVKSSRNGGHGRGHDFGHKSGYFSGSGLDSTTNPIILPDIYADI